MTSAAPEFRHEAALYAGREGFLGAALPFIGEALRADEPVMVAVSAEKIGLLQGELADDAGRVCFADMAELGANPARIIPAWLQFVQERSDPLGHVWGIGEPIGPDRSGASLVECQLHETLINLAFAQTQRFNLLCPYDTDALGAEVIAEAHRSHPTISRDGAVHDSLTYRDLAQAAAPCDLPLDAVPPEAHEMRFHELDSLAPLRRFVERRARVAGLASSRVDRLALAVNELVANSLIHGGGVGVLRIWEERDALICEVSDRGRFNEPLAGRRPPAEGQAGGWGLWLANQLCDLVQLRSYAEGGVARIHMLRQA